MPEILKNISRVNLRTQQGDGGFFGDVDLLAGQEFLRSPRAAGLSACRDPQRLARSPAGRQENRRGRGPRDPPLAKAPGAFPLFPRNRDPPQLVLHRDRPLSRQGCGGCFGSLAGPAPFGSHLAALLKMGKTAPAGPVWKSTAGGKLFPQPRSRAPLRFRFPDPCRAKSKKPRRRGAGPDG